MKAYCKNIAPQMNWLSSLVHATDNIQDYCNAYSDGTYEEQIKLAADGLRRLCEYGDKHGINVIVENHGGLSSNGAWLAAVNWTLKMPPPNRSR